jgi:two-component system, LuxR family, response regulator FixJ
MNTLSQPTVFVVDDDDPIREAIRWLLESVHLNVESYASAANFLQAYATPRAGCIILDVRMPGMSGLELLEELARRHNALPVMMLTGHGDVPMAVRAMKAGAVDFILKPFNDQLLLEQVQKMLALPVSPTVKLSLEQFTRRLSLLTSRERQVLKLVIEGQLNKQIAAKLNITISTVELHRSNIKQKLKIKNSAELIRLCTQANFIA